MTEGTSLHVITVIFGYRNLGKPLKILKISWVSSPSHLVLCYIVLPLFMNPHREKTRERINCENIVFDQLGRKNDHLLIKYR